MKNQMVRYAFRCSLGVALCVAALVPGNAYAGFARVMGSADEGTTLRTAYIRKMEKIESDRKQCRRDLQDVVSPQLVLMDEFGLLGRAGPSLGVKTEGEIRADAVRLNQFQNELLRLGRMLDQSGPVAHKDFSRKIREFEVRLRDFSLARKKLEENSNSLLGKSEQVVGNFAPFARAVLKIRNQEACKSIWEDLRPSIPKNMERLVLQNQERIREQIAAARADFQNFGMMASKMVLRFKTRSHVAAEESEVLE